MPHEQDDFETFDGLRLFENRWTPEAEPAAVLVVVHGFTEHGGRYEQAAVELNRHGYAVAAMDLRGHGRSEGAKAFVESFDQYVDDLDVQLARVRRRWPDLPLFLFGHSMGGTIIIRQAMKRPEVIERADIRGIVLSAPALQVADGLFPVLRRFVKLLARMFPRMRVVRLGSSYISRDPEVVADFRNDPLVFHDRFPVRTGAEMFDAFDDILANPQALRLPFFLLQGTDDKVVCPRACRRLISRAKSPDKELRLYEGFYHDLLHEIDREEVLRDIIGWLDARR
ncbi:MAG: alpha/beta hydrolase [Planctomycetota bacterium]|nr:alpha/beta hydrolase [Planctomycetota bacterium]